MTPADQSEEEPRADSSSQGSILRGWIDRALGVVEGAVGVLFFLVLIMELTNLALRVANKGIPQSTDIGGMTVFVLCFLGMARGFARGSHVRFDWLGKKAPPTVRWLFDAAAWGLSFVALALLAYLGLVVTIGFSGLYLRALSMPWYPMWITLAAMPIGAALSLFGLFHYLSRHGG